VRLSFWLLEVPGGVSMWTIIRPVPDDT